MAPGLPPAHIGALLTGRAGTTPLAPLLKGWERCRHNTFAASATGGAIKRRGEICENRTSEADFGETPSTAEAQSSVQVTANSSVLWGLDNGCAQPDDAGKPDADEMHGCPIENRLASAAFRNRPRGRQREKSPARVGGARTLEQKITKETKNSVSLRPFQWRRPGTAALDKFLHKPEQR